MWIFCFFYLLPQLSLVGNKLLTLPTKAVPVGMNKFKCVLGKLCILFPTKKCIRRVFSVSTTPLTDCPSQYPFLEPKKDHFDPFYPNFFLQKNHPSRRLFKVFGRVFL